MVGGGLKKTVKSLFRMLLYLWQRQSGVALYGEIGTSTLAGGGGLPLPRGAFGGGHRQPRESFRALFSCSLSIEQQINLNFWLPDNLFVLSAIDTLGSKNPGTRLNVSMVLRLFLNFLESSALSRVPIQNCEHIIASLVSEHL